MNEFQFSSVLSKIPEILSSDSSLDETMKDIINAVQYTVKPDYSAIYYLNDNTAYLKFTSLENKELFSNFLIPNFVMSKIAEEDEIFFDASSIDMVLSRICQKISLFPLKIKNAVFGFILIANKSQQLTNFDKSSLKTLSCIGAYAIKDNELSEVFKEQLKALQENVIEKNNALNTIKEQNQRIIEAEKIKNDFMTNMTHELRTPLNAIIGLSEVLSSKLFGELNPKQAEYVNDIYTSGVHLLGMINEILDLSKLEANAMKSNFSLFAPQTTIFEVINIVKPLAAKKSVQIVFDSDIFENINSDEMKFREIFYNLVHNAIKFSPENGKIMIKLEKSRLKSKEKAHQVRLSVKDEGIGISKENQEKVFEKFFQIENVITKKTASTGLGLTIVKKFAEMLGGTVELKSELNQGAEFIVEI